MIGIRQILVILGVILVIRLVGKVLTARRNINEHKAHQKQDRTKQHTHENVGKTSISKIDKESLKSNDYTAYEEVE